MGRARAGSAGVPSEERPGTAAVRGGERPDERRLAAYLGDALGLGTVALELEPFPGGHSNLTYLVRATPAAGPARELVLRRPPPGPVAPGAHDMGREFRVLSRLAPAFPLAPRVLLYCEDAGVIGAPFFAMERRRGLVLRGGWPEQWPADPGTRGRTAGAFLGAMAALHDVDYQAIGLGDLGRPQGFLERQVRRWRERWERARTRTIPELDRLAEALSATLPRSPAPVIVHNDFKFDNAMFDASDPGRLTAIFDWEMTTIGDPLVDLGTTLCYWTQPGDPPARLENPGALPPFEGFPSRREVVERYAEARGVDCSRVGWYEIFGTFKIAIVLEQLFLRYTRGHSRDPRFAAFEALVPRLAEVAVREAERTGLS